MSSVLAALASPLAIDPFPPHPPGQKRHPLKPEATGGCQSQAPVLGVATAEVEAREAAVPLEREEVAPERESARPWAPAGVTLGEQQGKKNLPLPEVAAVEATAVAVAVSLFSGGSFDPWSEPQG